MGSWLFNASLMMHIKKTLWRVSFRKLSVDGPPSRDEQVPKSPFQNNREMIAEVEDDEGDDPS
jgi:hypothetical protein